MSLDERRPSPQEYPNGSSRFDWIVTGLSAWMIVGVFTEIWANSHGSGSLFFISLVINLGPILNILAVLIFFLFHQIRNMRKGYSLLRALPKGYLLWAAGLAMIILENIIGGVFRSLWGGSGNLSYLNPLQLIYGFSALLLVSSPIWAIRARLSPVTTRGWKALAPLVLSAAFALSILTFLTQFVHPLMEPYAAKISEADLGQVSDLYVMNVDGTRQTRLTMDPKLYAWSADWSPDGRKIVFHQGRISRDRDTEGSLYIMNADGSNIRQLTDLPGEEYVPAWSPDGKRIAFVSVNDHKQVIAAINTDGSNFQQLTSGAHPAYGPAWSPDGKKIVYTSNATGTDQLYIMNADGSNSTQLTNSGAYNWGAVWSPDGSQIAFPSARDNNNSDLYVIRPDGSGEVRLTQTENETEYWPTWSPDSRRIAFVAWPKNKPNESHFIQSIYVMNADGSNLRNLSQNRALDITMPRWSPDGKSILFTASGHSTLPFPYQTTSLGIVSLLLQSGLLLSVALLLVRDWTLPVGALTFIFTLNGLLMSLSKDAYVFALAWFGAGLVADLFIWQFKPSARHLGRFWFFGFSLPVVFCAFYFLVLQLTQGIEWDIQIWLGAICLAGIGGLLLTRLALPVSSMPNPETVN
jgi:Tol biopolymer transport system component